MGLFYAIANYLDLLLPDILMLVWAFWILWNVFSRHYNGIADVVLGTRLTTAVSGAGTEISDNDDEDDSPRQRRRSRTPSDGSGNSSNSSKTPFYTNTMHFPVLSTLRDVPLEALLRCTAMLYWLLRIVGTTSTTDDNETFYHSINQAAVAFGFLLAFMVEAVTYSSGSGASLAGVSAKRIRSALPLHAEYYAHVLAWFNVLLVYSMQLSARNQGGIAVRMHELHVILLACTTLATVLECALAHSVGTALGRGYFILYQGMWMLCEGAVLTPQMYGSAFAVYKVWQDTSDDKMILVALFCVFALVSLFVTNMVHVTVVMVQRLKYGVKTYEVIMLHATNAANGFLQDFPTTSTTSKQAGLPLLMHGADDRQPLMLQSEP